MKTELSAQRVLERLKKRKMTLCSAESCTGGLIGKLLTDVPGSSSVYLGGIISYTNEVKMDMLGVSEKTLLEYSAVSEQTAREMAQGAREKFCADLAVSTTGIAGPSSDASGKPVGLVYIGVCDDTGCTVKELHLQGSRDEIRMQAAQTALRLIDEKTHS